MFTIINDNVNQIQLIILDQSWAMPIAACFLYRATCPLESM